MAEIYRSDIVRVDLDHALLRKHVGSILVTGDKLGNRFGAEIFRDGKPVDVTGCGVTAYFMRPGEDAIVLNGTASGSVAYVDLAQACYSKASSFTLTIKLSYGGSTTALRVIDGYILLTQTDELVDPGEVVPTLDDLLAQIEAMEQGTAAARNVVAEYEGKVAEQDASIAALTKDIAYYNNGVNRPYIGTPVIGSQINDSTGLFEVSASTNLIASEHYIRMEKGKKYFFATSSAVSFNVYFYDENKNYIRSFVPNSGLSSTTKIVNNAEYAYARIGMWQSGATIDDWNSITVVMNEKPREIVFVGDSITAGMGVSKTCAMWLAEHYGWTCLNYGIAGTGYICGMQGAHTMAGDGVEGVGAYRDITEVGDYLSRVSDLPAVADLYVIGGGYNDWNTNTPIESFKKRAAAVYEAIMTRSPNARILVLTPTRQYTSEKDSRNPNAAGYTLEDYANVIIEVCESMSIHCVDLYHSGGLYPVNSAQSAVYYSDGLHPTATGNRMIANVIARMCESLVWQII